jgi:hypothetical protein
MSSPTRDAVKALADAGMHEQAAALAIKYLKNDPATATPAPGAPGSLPAAWKAAEESGATLGLKHLRSLTVDQMGDLHANHKDLLYRSMESLKAGS